MYGMIAIFRFAFCFERYGFLLLDINNLICQLAICRSPGSHSVEMKTLDVFSSLEQGSTLLLPIYLVSKLV